MFLEEEFWCRLEDEWELESQEGMIDLLMFLVDDCCFPCRGPKYAELLADTEHERLEFVTPSHFGVTMVAVMDRGTTRKTATLTTRNSREQSDATSTSQQWHYNQANGVLSHTVNPPPEVNKPVVSKRFYFRDDRLIMEQNYPTQNITVKRTWRRTDSNKRSS